VPDRQGVAVASMPPRLAGEAASHFCARAVDYIESNIVPRPEVSALRGRHQTLQPLGVDQSDRSRLGLAYVGIRATAIAIPGWAEHYSELSPKTVPG
jgi:hypothetical protein